MFADGFGSAGIRKSAEGPRIAPDRIVANVHVGN